MKNEPDAPQDVSTTPLDADEAWLSSLDSERRWRERGYLGNETPLSKEALGRFTGLLWFPPNPLLRFQGVRLARRGSPPHAELSATGDDKVDFLAIGSLGFSVAGRAYSLEAFEPAPGEVDETYILVPFRDATSGTETYGGGRYLDLDPRADDLYELDFNRAYHPYCVHDEAWSCTVPPPQNRLPFRVDAGERL
ncbi:MAG: DUF1684 domain-containing protein [Euryarchaeota archaeon]|nr:DUF1684 domain-containing protein [Euryarchaeota archaeon]